MADYMADQINSRINTLSSEYFKHSKQAEFDDLQGRHHQNNGEMDAWIHDSLKRIYLLILTYLEQSKLPQMAQLFKERYESQLGDLKFMLESGSVPFDEGVDNYLYRLQEFEDFLLPFRAFNFYREERRLTTGMLEAVLSNTHKIMHQINKQPTNETSVYKSVHWFLEILYPDSKFTKTPLFSGKFKKYQPDLHVPELQAAIEYKLIRPESNPEDYIDQVKIDAVSYRGDDRYNLFYAVLYFLDNKSHKREAIESCWNTKSFPPNWKLIIVEG